MLTDICACDVSITDQEALTSWNNVVLGVLAHAQVTGDHLNLLLTQAPDFAMGHAMKGLACLLLGRREMVEHARAASATAQLALKQGGATERERLWCDALHVWLEGRPSLSIERMEQALRINPADTISMKLGHGIRFVLGDAQGMLLSAGRSVLAHSADHPLWGYALGCHAFALEENGQYAAAEKAGMQGLQYAADDAWGLHAVAHVYDMTHQVDRGIALLDANTGAWSHCNNFRFHVWWHKALLHLDQGEIDAVFDLYDTKIRDEHTDDYRDISNATSLLMRLELEGISVGTRWAELADLAETRTDDGSLTFADLHYLLALVGDGRADASMRLQVNIAQHASGDADMSHVMQTPGIAASAGLTAFGEAQYNTAFSHLKSAQSDFQLMGGSHAQRDVFERLTIEAGLRAGRLGETESLLQSRIAKRDGAQDTFAERRLSQIEQRRSLAVSMTASE